MVRQPEDCRRSSCRYVAGCWLLAIGIASLSLFECGVAAETTAVPFPQRPLRWIRLVTGEQFSAEWLGANAEHVQLRLPSGTTAQVPRGVVAEIANPRGVVDVWDSAVALQPPPFPPISAGVLHAQPVSRVEQAPPLTLNLDGPPSTGWAVAIGAQGICETAIPSGWRCDFRQRVPARPLDASPWHLCWDAQNWSVSHGAALIARGKKPPVSVTAIPLPANAAADWQSVVLRRTDARLWNMVSDDPQQDAVALDGGIMLYGHIDSVEDWGLRLAVEDRIVSVPWTDFRQAAFKISAARQEASVPVSGGIIERRRPEIGGLSPQPGERLLGAQLIDGQFQHPWLGRLPGGDPAHIQGRYQGSWTWLCPAMLHLGDEVQTNLAPANPQGTRWSGEWMIGDVPQGDLWVSVEAAELEPCGPQTPPTQPYLQELRAGHWKTELWINRRRIGDWNSQLSWRPGAATPERIRLALPAAALTVGKNVWELKQHPGPDGAAFDDIWIGRMALQVASPQP